MSKAEIISAIPKLSHAERREIMRVIFEMERNAEALESPEWHREVLVERERRIQSGESKFTDWEQAKADIRKRVL